MPLPMGTDERGRAAVRTFSVHVGEETQILKEGQAIVSNVKFETLWTAGVDKTWNSTPEPFYVASGDPADISKPLILHIVKEGLVQETIFVSTDAVDGQTPVLIPGGNMLTVQSGQTLDIMQGDVWIGRNNSSFVQGKPLDIDIEGHIAVDRGITKHGFYTVPARITEEKYQGTWRGTVEWVCYTSADDVTVIFLAQPVSPIIPGAPIWELDRQSFRGVSSTVKFDPPLGHSRGQRVALAGTRFELKGISQTGGNVDVEGRFKINLIRAGEFLDRDLLNVPP